jgi:thiamine monophosphate synthase
LFSGCEKKTKETQKVTKQEKAALPYTEKATKGPTNAMTVFIALSDKDASQSEVEKLCKEIVKEKGASNIRIFIYDDIKYTLSSLPVPENLDAHWLYLYAYNKNTGLDKLEKIRK